jgi:hypothetical protein
MISTQAKTTLVAELRLVFQLLRERTICMSLLLFLCPPYTHADVCTNTVSYSRYGVSCKYIVLFQFAKILKLNLFKDVMIYYELFCGLK